MELSIIILTRNREKLLSECIESVKKDKIKAEYEIIIIDNASSDGTRHYLEKEKAKNTKMIYIRNKKNCGVGKGRNIGLRHAKGSFVFFLDDDAVVKKGALEKMLKFMKKNKDCWVCGPKTFLPDGKLEYSCRTFYSLPIILHRRTPIGRLFPNRRHVKDHLMIDWDHNSIKSVDWVAGAGFMVNREAFNKIGNFENTKFGFEDVDYCYRVKKAGKKVYYVHNAEIIHRVTASSRKISINYFRHMWSGLKFLLKR